MEGAIATTTEIKTHQIENKQQQQQQPQQQYTKIHRFNRGKNPK